MAAADAAAAAAAAAPDALGAEATSDEVLWFKPGNAGAEAACTAEDPAFETFKEVTPWGERYCQPFRMLS